MEKAGERLIGRNNLNRECEAILLKPVVVCKTRSAEGSAFVSRNLTAAFIVTNTFARKGTSNEQTFTSIISAPLA